MHTNLLKILCFSCQGKSRDIVYQRICLFLWLIFAQHGLFEIQLTVYSALSRLTDLGIYDITRCGIWLLTIFHIPYIHFQRELRKVTSPKWHLSFFVQYIDRRNVLKTKPEKRLRISWGRQDGRVCRWTSDCEHAHVDNKRPKGPLSLTWVQRTREKFWNGTKNNNTSPHMLLDHCYTFGWLL